MAKKKPTTKKLTDAEIAAAIDKAKATGNTLPGVPVGGDAALAAATGGTTTTTAKPTSTSTTVATPSGASPTGAPVDGFTAQLGAANGAGAVTGPFDAIANLLLGAGWKKAQLADPNALNMAGLDQFLRSATNKAGPIRPVPKTPAEVIAWVRTLGADQISALQTSLFAAGFYPSKNYTGTGAPPPLGDRLGDKDFEQALAKAMLANAQTATSTGNPDSFGDLLAARMKENAPKLQAMQAAQAAEGAKATKAAMQAASAAEDAKKRAEAEATTRAAQLAQLGPTQTMPTTLLTLKSPEAIAQAAQDVATKLIGRRLNDSEVSMYTSTIHQAELDYLTQQTDLAAYNRQLSDPYPAQASVPITNPQMNLGSAQPSAPTSQYVTAQQAPPIRTDGSSDSRTDGMNPVFASALGRMQQAAAQAGFDIIVGSGHRTVAEQTALYNASDKSGKMVGSPKGSKHVLGQAADLRFNGKTLGQKGTEAAMKWVHDNAAKFGLNFPMSYEPWHIEHVSTRTGKDAPDGTNVNRPGSSAAVTSTPAKAQPAAAGTGKGSVAWRNNNPGNLVYGATAKALGAVGKDERGFAIFPDEATGERALLGLLARPGYAKLTLADAMKKWTSGDNSVGAQNKASMIAKRLGVSTGALVSSLDQNALAAAIRATEGWKPGAAKSPGASSATLASMSTTGAPATPATGGPGGSLARGVTPYPGATVTAHGGLVLPYTEPDPQAMVEADLRKNHPADVMAQAFTGARSVFQQLFGGI